MYLLLVLHFDPKLILMEPSRKDRRGISVCFLYILCMLDVSQRSLDSNRII